MTRLSKQRWIAFGLVIASAVVAAFVAGFWGLASFAFVSYMSSHVPTQREIIDFAWPHQIVPPSWFADTADGTLRWTVAEAAARLSIILACWLAFVLFVRREYHRRLATQ